MDDRLDLDFSALFAEAVDLDATAQESFLQEIADRDPAVASELRALLEADSAPGLMPEHASEVRLPDSFAEKVNHESNSNVLAIREALEEIESYSAPATRYALGEELGRGAMGRVARAWDRSLKRQLAIKTLHALPRPNDPSETSAMTRFMDEARITGQLEHPGIVPVHDMGLDAEGRVFFTMQRVQGRELGEVFDLARDEQKGWSTTRVLGVLQRVCEAMSYAHSQGVLHRDLKPSNVMVGSFGEVYVMDWGVARREGETDSYDLRPQTATGTWNDDGGSPVMTMDGMIIGTPHFMPPEQALGIREGVDQRADVYALGAMLYLLLTGREPYKVEGKESSPRQVLLQLMKGPPAPVAEISKDAPAELIAICEKAMAWDADHRYPDMGSLREDLRAFLEQRVVHAYETGAIAELRKWVKRHRTEGLLAALLFVSVLLGLGGYSYVEARSSTALAAKNKKVVAERDKATSMKGLLIEMLSSADPAKGSRSDLMVRDVLEQMGDRLETDLVEHPELCAETHLVLASSYLGLHMLEPSVRHRRSALELYRELQPGDSEFLARMMVNVADGGVALERDADELAADIALAREGIAMARKLGNDFSEVVILGVSTLTALRTKAATLTNNEKDESEYLETLALGANFIFGITGGKWTEPEILEWLKGLPDRVGRAWDAGDMDEVTAILHTETKETIEHSLWGRQVPYAYMRYADLLDGQGLTSAAAGVRYEAFNIAVEVLSTNSLALAKWRLAESRQAMIREDVESARDLCNQALESLVEFHGPSEPATVEAVLQLASIYEASGQHEQATQILESGRQLVSDDNIPAGHPNHARMVKGLALDRLRRGDTKGARELLHGSVLALDERSGDRGSEQLARMRIALADALLQSEDAEAAERELLTVLDWTEAKSRPRRADVRAEAGLALTRIYKGMGKTKKLAELTERLQRVK